MVVVLLLHLPARGDHAGVVLEEKLVGSGVSAQRHLAPLLQASRQVAGQSC
jgi:hypothetical protein